ncbi:hypothetical protein KRX11_10060 [Pasteurellaceae bacterium TAE3-ERU1]|uniref:hypothetical protein n=1 Tax=Spirabiliibacterium mucosae TaxID=28156 RepID=UPI001AACE028|nr:hypothetical protein [Spirabiliibacterium mucosae]MBE2898097.1 hypothetical protein [Spirabiliibacterium mucosae]MBV7388977.1 hypothetical protein [Pasteurellaceae bacterium TAE3-ERU1]
MSTISALITEQDILNCINPKYRNFFDIIPFKADQSVYSIFEPFIEAANIICKFADINKRVFIHFIFDEALALKSEHFTLNFSLRADAFHIHYNGSIFYYMNRVQKFSKEFQVVACLEELAHAFMNITDETLVKQVVCLMYPKMKYDPVTNFYSQKIT